MSPVVKHSRLDWLWMSRYFRHFLWMALGLHLAWFLFGFLWPYHWTLVAALLGPLPGCLFANRSANRAVNRLYGWTREDISSQEWLASEMARIRSFKRQRSFDKALALVNHVLAQYPNFPEALYLKAQVFWEGFKNPWAAESYFTRVIELTEDSEPVHRWASSCLSGLYSRVGR